MKRLCCVIAAAVMFLAGAARAQSTTNLPGANILGREGSAAETQSWVQAMGPVGLLRAQVAVLFIFSEEFRLTPHPHLDAFLLYAGFLQRVPIG